MIGLDGVFDYLATRRLAVVCSVHPSGLPAAALVGIALTPARSIIVDTQTTSRKAANLRLNGKAALDVGWDP